MGGCCFPQVFSQKGTGIRKNNWKKSDKKTPENLNLITEYYSHFNKGYRINLQKVKGHSNNRFNELADKLATQSIYIKDLDIENVRE